MTTTARCGYAHVSSTASPPGANNFACKPSGRPSPSGGARARHIRRHVDSWQALSPLLHNNGYCVFALNYGSYAEAGALGIYATGDNPQTPPNSSRRSSNEVLAATKASQVDIVGHSQGGMMPRYYLKNLGGAAKVHTLVGLAPSNHGTTPWALHPGRHSPASTAFLGDPVPGLRTSGPGIVVHTPRSTPAGTRSPASITP